MEMASSEPSASLMSMPPAKRRRIQLACISCRDRKSRCDGGRPSCAACERRNKGRECMYDQRAISSTKYYGELEDRLKRLERMERGDWAKEEEVPARDSSTASKQIESRPVLGESPARVPGDSSLVPVYSPEEESPGQVDALATVMSPENEDSCLYGESSTIAFLRQVEQCEQGDDSLTTISKSTVDRNNLSVAIRPLKITNESDLALLPIRYRADMFLACYWDFVHPLFPLLHKTEFMAKYHCLWLPQGKLSTRIEDILFLSHLNLVFALGCQFCSRIDPNEQLAMAAQFYDRSQHVWFYDILGSTSPLVVQWLLLTTVYCQSTNHASRCWNSAGLAIRLAQSLGLHMELPVHRENNQIQVEMRRRIWHTCVVLDRLMAMTFGRPLMVRDSYNTRIPSLIDDEYLQETGIGTQPTNIPSRMGLFVSSCKLFEILSDILSSFYVGKDDLDSKNDARMQELATDVLNFNRRLDQFSASIPGYLKTTQRPWVFKSPTEGYINLQQQVLYCRFLYTRVLSLRPLLLMASRDSLEDTCSDARLGSTLDDELVQRCCDLCINTAHQLIEAIHQHLNRLYKSSGWHSVYFIFASATILLASIKLRGDTEDFAKSFEVSWDRCLAVLSHYKMQIQAAPRAIKVLETLRVQIETARSQERQRLPGQQAVSSESVVRDEIAPQGQEDFAAQLDLSQFNFDVTNSLSDTWFSQQVINLEYMEAI